MKRFQGSRWSIILASIAVVLIWGTSFSISQPAIESLGVWPFRLYASALSLAIIFIIVNISRNYIFSVSYKQYSIAFILTILCNGAIVPILNNYALLHTEASTVVVLVYTMPAFTTILESFISRAVSWPSIATATLCIAGIVTYTSTKAIGLGEVIVLLSALLWSIGTISAKRTTGGSSGRYDKLLLQLTLSFLIALAVITFTDRSSINLLLNIPYLSAQEGFAIIYTGIVNTIVVFYLWYLVIERMGSEKASYTTLFVPIIGVYASRELLSDIITRKEVIGCVLISCSIAFSYLTNHTKTAKNQIS